MKRKTKRIDIKKIVSFWIVVVSLLSLFSCKSENKKIFEDEKPLEINPLSDASTSQMMQVNFYYKYSFTDMLSGKAKYISVPVNEGIEQAVLRELINGPGVNGRDFIQLINADTDIVNIYGNNSTLNVTFSKEFLEFIIPEGSTSQQTRKIKQLAVYSVVNTLIEVSNYTKIQILVDKNGSGKGERMSKTESGFDGEGFLEPLTYNTEVMLTPENTMLTIFNAMTRKDYEELYFYIAYKDTDSSVKIDESIFVTRMLEKLPSVEGYTVLNCVVSADGNSAIVITDYNLRISGEICEFNSMPVKLIKENDSWKLQFSRFETLFSGI